jgi:hypothetical protein
MRASQRVGIFLLLSFAEALLLNQPVTRRHIVAAALGGATALVSVTTPAIAACLPGDLSKECIGVYKVPMDDNIAGMVGTKEALEKNAPGLNYVPPIAIPKSFAEAMSVLETQRKAADDIRTVVSAGRLEEAGIQVLNLIPKVTAAGRVIAQSVTSGSQLSEGAREVRNLQLQSKLDDMVANFGQLDITIGQGLRGEMGVVTAAQLNILSDLKDALIAFDEFLNSIPTVDR